VCGDWGLEYHICGLRLRVKGLVSNPDSGPSPEMAWHPWVTIPVLPLLEPRDLEFVVYVSGFRDYGLWFRI
jgi:hypothetical protein